MIRPQEERDAIAYTVQALEAAGIELTAEERDRIEIADFALSRLPEFGLQLLSVR